MTRFTSLSVESRQGFARVTLNRPERRNAFDGGMVGDLTEAFRELGLAPETRGIVLTGAGPVFCAGADLRWMSQEAPIPEAQAQADAERLIRMYRTIDECPCPVIARVQGSAFGGGVGLLAVCDIVVAVPEATLALSEVRLGLVPAVIAPFLLRTAGESFMRRYCLTGEAFSVEVARRYNLIHDIVEAGRLDDRTAELAGMVMHLAPRAARDAKAFLRRLLTLPEAERWAVCARANAEARLSDEASEGLRAFLDKRPAAWTTSQVPEQRHDAAQPTPDAAGRRA